MMTSTHLADFGPTPAKQPCGCGCGCGYGPFSRNNYWYGKLMLPQDFTDEQTYLRDKIRLHNQRLHGTGVVCGLIMQQDTVPGCQDRIVDITAGLALDCCGNEIVVPDLLRVDITTLPAVQALDLSDDATHELQLRLCYRECPTEPVPVLYDECACADGRCLPNRILESYDVEVVVDPVATADAWTGPALVRDTDIALAGARHVRVVGGLLYVAVDSTLYQIDPASRATLGSTTLSGSVLALEGAADGSAVFAVHDDASGITLTTLKTADLTVVNTGPVPGASTTPVTAVGADGRLIVLLDTGAVLRYDTDLASSATPAAATGVTVPAGRTLLALTPDAGTAYLAAADPGAADPTLIDVVDLAGATAGTPLSVLPAGAQPTMLAITAGTLVVAASDDHAYAIALPAGTLAGSIALPGSPFASAGLALGLRPGHHRRDEPAAPRPPQRAHLRIGGRAGRRLPGRRPRHLRRCHRLARLRRLHHRRPARRCRRLRHRGRPRLPRRVGGTACLSVLRRRRLRGARDDPRLPPRLQRSRSRRPRERSGR